MIFSDISMPDMNGHELAERMSSLRSAGKLRAYEAQSRFFEIGSEAGIADLETKLAGPISG